MNGLPRDGGDHLAGAGAELALNALTGRERAQAVAHLQRCGLCQARVAAMAVTDDDLLGLLPGVTPPAGFSDRAVRRLRPPRRSRRSRGRHARPRVGLRVAMAVAVVLVAAGGTAGWAMRAASEPARSAAAPILHSAALITPAHRAIGKVFLQVTGSAWMFVAVDTSGEDTTLTCQLITVTGRLVTLGRFELLDGEGYWGSPASTPPAAIAGAQLVTGAGTVLATAWFTSATLTPGPSR